MGKIHTDAGKGDSPRPFSIPYDEYADRWEYTFNRAKWEKPTITEVSPDHNTESIPDEHSSETDRPNAER
jgi:hypothetical protein